MLCYKSHKNHSFHNCSILAGAGSDDDDSDMDVDKLKQMSAEAEHKKARKKAGLPELEVDALPSTVCNRMMILAYMNKNYLVLDFVFFNHWVSFPICCLYLFLNTQGLALTSG